MSRMRWPLQLLLLALGVVLGWNPNQMAVAAPALRPSAKEQQRKLQFARILTLSTQLQGEFERVKIGKDSVDTYLDLLDAWGRAKRDAANTPQERIAATLEALRLLAIADEQFRELAAAGLGSPETVGKTASARQRTADLLKSLAGDP